MAAEGFSSFIWSQMTGITDGKVFQQSQTAAMNDENLSEATQDDVSWSQSEGTIPDNGVTWAQPTGVEDNVLSLVTTSTDVDYQDDTQSLRIAAQLIFGIARPVVLVIGLIGNLLSLIIMRRKAFKNTSVSIYLSALAISDTLTLILASLANMLETTFKVNVTGSNDAFCKFHSWALAFSYTFSAWITVAVSVERAVVVWNPFKGKRLCTAHSAKLAVVCIAVASAVIRLVRFWSWHRNASGKCTTNTAMSYYVTNVQPWLIGVTYSYMPIIILVFCNTCIILKLYRAKKNREQMTNAPSGDEKDHTASKVTRSVVAVCLFYVLFTLPVAILQIIRYACTNDVARRPEFTLALTIIYNIGALNYSINFFLYVVTSSVFRQEIILFFCCRKPSQPVSHSAVQNDPSCLDSASSEMTSVDGRC